MVVAERDVNRRRSTTRGERQPNGR
jgi:hypothetical protein